MVHRLTGIVAAVADHAVAVLQFFGSGDGGDGFENVGDNGAVFSSYTVNRGDVALGNHKDVGRCLGSDVAKCEDLIVPIDLGGGDLTGNNFTEQAIHGVGLL